MGLSRFKNARFNCNYERKTGSCVRQTKIKNLRRCRDAGQLEKNFCWARQKTI